MELKDRIEIERLIFLYARSVDTAQWGNLQTLFDSAVVTANRTDVKIEGGQAIADYWRDVNRTHANGTLNTHHVVTNLEFHEAADGAVLVKSAFTVFQATEALPLQPIACGRYDDTFEKRDGAWRFRSKHIDVTLMGNMSQHLNISLG